MSNLQMSSGIVAIPRAARKVRFRSRRHVLGQSRKRQAWTLKVDGPRMRNAGRRYISKVARSPTNSSRVGCNVSQRVCNSICRNKKVGTAKTERGACAVRMSWTADLMEGRHDS